MKYIVELERTVKKTVYIEANNLSELDRLLMENKPVFENEIVTSTNVYCGYNYINHQEYGDDETIICSTDDFISYHGCKTFSGVERHFFKYTNCGMCIEDIGNGIIFTGYVEGEDGYMPNETLYYPFPVSVMDSVVNRLDGIACELFEEKYSEDELT